MVCNRSTSMMALICWLLPTAMAMSAVPLDRTDVELGSFDNTLNNGRLLNKRNKKRKSVVEVKEESPMLIENVGRFDVNEAEEKEKNPKLVEDIGRFDEDEEEEQEMSLHAREKKEQEKSYHARENRKKNKKMKKKAKSAKSETKAGKSESKAGKSSIETMVPTMVPTISTTPTVYPTDSPTTYSPTTSFPTFSPTGCVHKDQVWNFDNGVFPIGPWSTGGAGDWAIFNNTLKSPDLEGLPVIAISNATLEVCDDFPGGQIRLQLYSSVSQPQDAFFISLDGEEEGEFFITNGWVTVAFGLLAGAHRIDFSYVYITEDTGQGNPDRKGYVMIDDVEICTGGCTAQGEEI